ncbi:hypothetical protein Nmel_004631 [Mimus melanotis]
MFPENGGLFLSAAPRSPRGSRGATGAAGELQAGLYKVAARPDSSFPRHIRCFSSAARRQSSPARRWRCRCARIPWK